MRFALVLGLLPFKEQHLGEKRLPVNNVIQNCIALAAEQKCVAVRVLVNPMCNASCRMQRTSIYLSIYLSFFLSKKKRHRETKYLLMPLT